MSEYTNYFAIKSSSEKKVQNKLSVKKIKSVVDADLNDFWFSPNYKRNGIYNWVVVSAPANSGFDNDQFFYNDQFNEMGAIFDTLILFFQEENFTNWRMKVKIENTIIEKKFVSNEETMFSENEKELFFKCFNQNFVDLLPFLKAGKGAEFLNFVGIPYIEMNDQNKISTQIFDKQYALLASEISD